MTSDAVAVADLVPLRGRSDGKVRVTPAGYDATMTYYTASTSEPVHVVR